MKRTQILLVAFIALFAFSFAFAVNENPRKVKAAEETRNAKLTNCERVRERVENRVRNFERSRENHLESYSNTLKKLERFIKKAENAGYETATLKEDIILFEAKVEKFKTDYQAYSTLLRETKEYTCEKSSGEFRTKLQTAREQLKLVHEDAVAIRTFYAKTFRLHILDLKGNKDNTETEREVTNE